MQRILYFKLELVPSSTASVDSDNNNNNNNDHDDYDDDYDDNKGEYNNGAYVNRKSPFPNHHILTE